MPKNSDDVPVDPTILARFDGFSPSTQILTVFDGALDTSNLPDETRIPMSLEDGSPTVLLDASTGERIPHFAEIDQWPGTDPMHAPFYIRPAHRLDENAHYIVAIRDIHLADGSALEPTPYFRALRDGTHTSSSELEGRRAHFEEIFTTLANAGVDRSSLLVAWDFRTASGEAIWSDLVTMRDDAMMRVGDRGLGCTITNVEEPTTDDSVSTFRFVEGTITTPLYMESERPGVRLHRGADGKPAFNGMAEIPFTVVIPRSVAEQVGAGGPPARLMTYGHGLFGSQGEVRSGWIQDWIDQDPTVAAATNWWGMSEDDVLNAAEALADMSKFPTLPERLTQGIVNFLVMTRTLAGVCSEKPELGVDGHPTIDGNDLYYLGISQGGIMGGSVAALSQDIERFVLMVGGIEYPVMVKRSVDFPPYSVILTSWYDALDADILLVASALLWDLAEPSTYISHIVNDPLPGSPAKRVLYMISQDDAQVPNVASDMAVRTMGIPLLVPTVRDVWGVETTMGPADSAYVQYHIDGVDPIAPGTHSPNGDNPAHEGVRRTPAALMQMDAFMHPDGVITSFCDGPCDPE